MARRTVRKSHRAECCGAAMDPALVSAGGALIGSTIGAASSIATTWMAQRGHHRAQLRLQEAARREAIHADFITEVSKRLADGISRPAERVEVMVGLEAAIGRMRLSSSREAIVAAEKLIKLVAETCASPNLSSEEVLAPAGRGVADPLAEFGEACRAGLHALRRCLRGGVPPSPSSAPAPAPSAAMVR